MSRFNLVIITVFLTVAFEFSDGWHDAANSIATVVSTSVLTAFRAVLWATSAFWNILAALVLSLLRSEICRVNLVRKLGTIFYKFCILNDGFTSSKKPFAHSRHRSKRSF